MTLRSDTYLGQSNYQPAMFSKSELVVLSRIGQGLCLNPPTNESIHAMLDFLWGRTDGKLQFEKYDQAFDAWIQATYQLGKRGFLLLVATEKYVGWRPTEVGHAAVWNLLTQQLGLDQNKELAEPSCHDTVTDPKSAAGELLLLIANCCARGRITSDNALYGRICRNDESQEQEDRGRLELRRTLHELGTTGYLRLAPNANWLPTSSGVSACSYLLNRTMTAQ